MKSKIYIFLLLIGIQVSAQQQLSDPKTDNFIERKIETIAENSSEDIDFTTVFEALNYYRERPLELNTATAEDLQQLYIVSDFQIAALITYREKYGKLLSIYELQAVPGFDLPTIYQLLPFVKVSRDLNRLNISFRDILKYANQEVVLRSAQVLQEQVGYSESDSASLAENPNSRYLGSPQR
jgi:hypothetical protein